MKKKPVNYYMTDRGLFTDPDPLPAKAPGPSGLD